jgi:autotransporter-associated beta strand protein
LIGGNISGINLNNLTVNATPPTGDAYTLSTTVDPGYIDLVVGTSGPVSLLWDKLPGSTGDGTTWQNNPGGTDAGQNWNNSGTASSFTTGDAVTFTDVNAGNYNVTVASNVLPASVTVNAAGTYNISGGFAIGNVPSGITPLTQSGGGLLNISNVNTFTGATNISGSGTTLHLLDTGSLATASVTVGSGSILNLDGLLTNTPAVVVSGTINLGGSDVNNDPTAGYLVRTWSSLNISSGAKVVFKPATSTSTRTVLVTSLASNLGKIDLSSNDMIIENASMGTVSTAGSIANQIASGFNNGAWNGSTGITSSAAASNTTHLTAIGYKPGGSTFDGISTTSSEILVKYTYYGDANLSGSVDGSDYSLIDNGYLEHLTGWYNGDFNYDGVVNGSDYTLIDNAFNSQGTSLAAEIASPTAEPTAQLAGSSSAVPEPASLGLLVIGAAGLLGRRKRRI